MQETYSSFARRAFGMCGLAALLLLAACKDKPVEPAVIGPQGGTVVGPDSVTLVVPAGVIESPVAVTIGVMDPKDDASLGSAQVICGKTYLIQPFNTPFKVLVDTVTVDSAGTQVKRERQIPGYVTVSIPESKCEGGALMYGQPGKERWRAAESQVEGSRRVGNLTSFGVVGVGQITFVPSKDTTVYVGATFDPRLYDARGQQVEEASISIRTTDADRLSADREYAGGKLRAKVPGYVGIEVRVPVMGEQGTKTLGVQIVENPAKKLQVLAGDGQSAEIGYRLTEPVVIQVLDSNGAPVQGAWVDFYRELADRVDIVGGMPTDKEGKAEVVWRMPGEAGSHTLKISVPGTSLKATVKATATSAAM